MGIYIKGMDMPQNCCDCFMDKFKCLKGKSEMPVERMAKERHPKCPLVFVSPHGDLIDRTKLYTQTAEWEADAMRMTLDTSDKDVFRKWVTVLGERTAFKHDVADAPTVIDAEDEKGV